MPFLNPPSLSLQPAGGRLSHSNPAVLVMTVSVACAALTARARVGLGEPLWLDEGWTGALATLPSFSDLLSFAREDSNAPAYYALIWAWAKVFGSSNVALHIPSLALGCAAPLAAWLGLRGSRPRLALAWAATIGLWGPAIVQSGFARCYPLLLVVAVLCCVCFIRLIDAPTRGRAVAWALSGAALVLTQYHGALLVAFQGTAWLALHRRRALSHWPAALAFAPAAAWLVWHMPILSVYAEPGLAWYPMIGPEDLPVAAAISAGLPFMSIPAAMAGLFLLRVMAQGASEPARRDRPVDAAGFTALASAALFLFLCCFRPLFAARYVTSFAPGVLLLVAASLVAASRGRAGVFATLLGGYAVLSSIFWLCLPPSIERVYSYEKASSWLAAAGPKRLVFLFDNTSALATAPRLLDRIGGFFLRREGLDLSVEPIVAPPGSDMNAPLLAEAGGHTAFLWLSETSVHDTSVLLHPPRLAEARADLECRDFGAGSVSIYACRPRSGS